MAPIKFEHILAADFLWIYFTNWQEYQLYYFLWIYFTNWQEYTNIICIISFRYIAQIGTKLRLICQYVAADFIWIYFTNWQEYQLYFFPLDIFYKLARIYQYHLYYFLQIYFTNWQEITIDMLVRGDTFQVFIQATLVSLQAPGRLLNKILEPFGVLK